MTPEQETARAEALQALTNGSAVPRLLPEVVLELEPGQWRDGPHFAKAARRARVQLSRHYHPDKGRFSPELCDRMTK